MSTPATPTAPTIDFAKIKAQVSSLSKDDLQKKVLAFRTRQLTQQKKQAAKGSQALYNKKRNLEFKEMKAEAQKLPSNHPHKYANLWEEINAQADAASDEKLNEFLDAQPAAETDETEDEEVTQ